MVDGLSFNLGYSELETSSAEDGASDNNDQHEGTFNLNYAIGAVSIGAQKSVVNASGTSETKYDSEYFGISYAVSDNLSVSYNNIESNKNVDGTDVDQDFDSISLSYTVGGMTIGVLDAEADNASYSAGRTQSARSVQMTVAF